MKLKPGIADQIFSALGNAKINIRTIAQGSDEISILVGVDNKDFECSIQVLYEAFIQ
jgi:aspartate kinase